MENNNKEDSSVTGLRHPLVLSLLLPYLNFQTTVALFSIIADDTKQEENKDNTRYPQENRKDYLSIFHDGICNSWCGALVSPVHLRCLPSKSESVSKTELQHVKPPMTVISILNLLDDIAYRNPLRGRSDIPSFPTSASSSSVVVISPRSTVSPNNNRMGPDCMHVHPHLRYSVREGLLHTLDSSIVPSDVGIAPVPPIMVTYPSSRAWIRCLSSLMDSTIPSYMIMPSSNGPGKYLFTRLKPYYDPSMGNLSSFSSSSSTSSPSSSRYVCMDFPLQYQSISSSDNTTTTTANTVELDLMGKTHIHSYYYMNTLRSSSNASSQLSTTTVTSPTSTVSSSPVAIGYFKRLSSSSHPLSSSSLSPPLYYSRLALTYETPYLDGGGSKIVLYDTEKLITHLDKLSANYTTSATTCSSTDTPIYSSTYQSLLYEGMRPALIDKFVPVNSKGETLLATALAFDGGNIDLDYRTLHQLEYMRNLQNNLRNYSPYKKNYFSPFVDLLEKGNENLLAIGSFSSIHLFDLRIPKFSFGHTIPVLSPVSWFQHSMDVYVRTVALDSTTNRIGMGCSNGKTYIFDIRKPGEFLFAPQTPSTDSSNINQENIPTTSFTPATVLTHNAYNGWTEEIRNLAFIPFSPYIITNCYDGTLRLWCDNSFMTNWSITEKNEPGYSSIITSNTLNTSLNDEILLQRSSSAPNPFPVSTIHSSVSSSTMSMNRSANGKPSPQYRILSSGDTSCESLKLFYQFGPLVKKENRYTGTIDLGITILSSDWLGKTTIAHCSLPSSSILNQIMNNKQNNLRTNSLNSYFTPSSFSIPNDDLTVSVDDVRVNLSVMDVLDTNHVKPSLSSSSSVSADDLLQNHVGLDRTLFTEIDSTTDLIVPPEPLVRDIERIPSRIFPTVNNENSYGIEAPALIFVSPPVRRSTNSLFPRNASSIWLCDPLGL